MWHAMFVEQIPLAEKVLRETVIVYAFMPCCSALRASGAWRA